MNIYILFSSQQEDVDLCTKGQGDVGLYHKLEFRYRDVDDSTDNSSDEMDTCLLSGTSVFALKVSYDIIHNK